MWLTQVTSLAFHMFLREEWFLSSEPGGSHECCHMWPINQKASHQTWNNVFQVALPYLCLPNIISSWCKVSIHLNCYSLVHFRWGDGAEVWFLNTPAFLFHCRLTQTKIKFWFCSCWGPFTFGLSHWFFDRKHILFSSTSPRQSHYGFFWNVCQFDHDFGPLSLFP